jgi:pimeloyl-ACP methyl ester carboxylesterase
MAKATEVATTQKVVRAEGVELATEAFGDPAHPPVLLVMGATASMLWWPDEFCRRLAAQGRYVIRYDNRDTGLSTTWEPGHPAIRSPIWPTTWCA